jgi:hypothetical protein
MPIADMLSRIATAARPLVRQMSGDAAQAAKDATLWKYIGFAATAASLTFAGVKVSPSLARRIPPLFRHLFSLPGFRSLVPRSPHRGSHQVPLFAQA